MGRAAAVLSTPRIAGFAALAAIVGVYYGTHQWWFELSLWPALAFICLLVIPAVFAFVWLALPLSRAPLRQLVVLAVACGAAAVLLQWAGAGILANFGKLAAMTFVGWCFLRFFEELSWVVLVACIVPWVDAYSVWRGPTNTITQKHEHVFFTLSFEFPVPGSDAGARLGLPDLLFFALYLGAAARWNLRVGWTWVCLTASLGGTLALATWPALDVSGLPALPLLSLGFLLPNVDLLWREVQRALKRRRDAEASRPGSQMSQRVEKSQPLDPESAEYAHAVTERLRGALGEKLVAVYLHGSAALGDFLRGQSDIDVVAVSDGPLTDEEAGTVADRLSSESLPCPACGLELHVVDRDTLEEPLDTPPFELHIATTRSGGPDRVVAGRGQGGDPDLVMHFAVLRERGVALLGPPATETFPPVSRARLVQAFAIELRWALEHASPTYQVLNACRAWRFLEENVLSSKLAGGEWARERVEHPLLIDAAIENRRGESDAQPKAADARAFVETVLDLLEQSVTLSG